MDLTNISPPEPFTFVLIGQVVLENEMFEKEKDNYIHAYSHKAGIDTPGVKISIKI